MPQACRSSRGPPPPVLVQKRHKRRPLVVIKASRNNHFYMRLNVPASLAAGNTHLHTPKSCATLAKSPGLLWASAAGLHGYVDSWAHIAASDWHRFRPSSRAA
eukprot:2725284-Amphidinium_carterae.1